MNKLNAPQLLFVYNANSTIQSKTFDYFHKMISPETYECNLCAITYDNFGKRKEWKRHLNSIPYDYKFLYKDQLIGEFSDLKKESFPAIYLIENKKRRLIASSKDINKVRDMEELIKLMNIKIGKRV